MSSSIRPTRRQMMKIGILGTGFSLSNYLQLLSAATNPGDAYRSGILVFLKGGPSHQDTFDLKPNAPKEYRGEFRPIATSVPGVAVCEHLPKLAQRADRYAIVRGITHTDLPPAQKGFAHNILAPLAIRFAFHERA